MTRVALVTGASLIIGSALARELCAQGFVVYAGDLNLRAISYLRNFGIIPILLDITHQGSVESAREMIESNNGQLDVLVNNTDLDYHGAATDMRDKDIIACYNANVFGPMRVVRKFAPLLIKAEGTITFTGSVAGIFPLPFSSTYNSLKAAIHQYAATLRMEMKPFNVKVLNFVTGSRKSDHHNQIAIRRNSIYNRPDLNEAYNHREVFWKSRIDPDEYAARVVRDILVAGVDSSFDNYLGVKTPRVITLQHWCPRWIVEKILVSQFKLGKAYRLIRSDSQLTCEFRFNDTA